MLQPLVRRTWAPVGQTPILRMWQRHDRISALSGLTVSPRQRRIGLYFRLQRHNLHWPETVFFVRRLQCWLGRKIILVLDRSNVHRSAVRWLRKKYPRSIHVAWLPAYAPQLNPVEQVWNNTKHGDLANYIPNGIGELEATVRASLKKKRRDQSLLRSFFKEAKLIL